MIACFVIMFVFACGGGGCSGCAGCGVQPIPGGFPAAAPRIANAGQIRLTSSGIGFLETNISGIVERFLEGGLNFPIPRISQDLTVADAIICPANDCRARAEIANIDLIPTGPNRIHAVIQLVVDSRGPDGARRHIPVVIDWPLVPNTNLRLDLDTRNPARRFIALETDIILNEETRSPRTGFTRIDVGAITEVPGQGIEDADVTISGGGLIGGLLNLFKGTIVNQLRSQLSSALDGAFDNQFCTTAGTTGCPTGTVASGSGPDAICRFSAGGDCAPSLLGTDGQGDLGDAFLGSLSPGTHAPIQYVLASGGQGLAMNDGMSLYMTGGFLSYDRAFRTTPGHNACVPRTERPAVPSIARVPAFQSNTIPGTATPVHLGIGVAEDYLNYAGWGMFDSGMFCLGVGTRLSQQLSTGLFSALVPTLRSLTYPEGASPISLAVRPQQPPVFTIGTTASQPLLTLTLPQAQIDFYVWSQERYVRFMTYQTDLVIALNLAVEGGQIVPSIVSITPTNSSVTNSELLVENQEALAMVIEGVITTFAGMLGSSIPPIDLPAIMGFNLTVPPMGIRGVSDGGERFLGIFANLALAPVSPLVSPVETSLELSDMEINPETMGMETFGQNGRNTVWLHFGAESAATGVEYEYSYRIDGALWSPWTRDRRVQIDDPTLLFQAHHQVEARARVVGSPLSVDRTPASQNLLIDILAPEVTLEDHESGNGVYVLAQDIVSSDEALQMRWRVVGGEFSAWTSVFDLDFDASILEVEVRDEAGNVGRSTPPLIRGLPNPNRAAGCGCRVVSSQSGSASLGWLAALAGLGIVLARRSRRARSSRPFDAAPRVASIALAVCAAASIASGCDCGGNPGTGDSGVRPDARGMACGGMECTPASTASPMGQLCCESSNMCVSYDLNAICMPGFTCPPGNEMISATCTVTCSMCMELPPLLPGILATDLDLATNGTTSYLAGYSAGVPPQNSLKYGDLVFGTLAPGDASTVTWEIVDGAPASPVTAAPSGWRRGVSAPGDDVGRYASMVRSAEGTFYIAYYDATNTALKIAVGRPGAWTSHVVDATADSGRFTSIALSATGTPVISYMRAEPAMDGRTHSAVRVAVAASATPSATANWTTTEVSALDVPCRPEFCEGAAVCLESGTCAMPGTGCSGCTSDQACIAGTCTAALPDTFVEDLFPGRGLYTRLVSTATGLALIFYDRSEGNLYGTSFSGTWSAPFLIDGYDRAGGGDSGASASLFVDAMGDWHVAYVDGTDETLAYARVRAGAVVERAIVDDGSTDGATMHTDGRHVVGDDASIVVTSTGEVRIAYQDSTAHTAVLATRPSTGGMWTIRVLDDMDATGFWIDQEVTGATSRVATWWRRQMALTTINGVRVLNVD